MRNILLITLTNPYPLHSGGAQAQYYFIDGLWYIYIWHFVIQQIIFLYLGQINIYLFFLLSLVVTALIATMSYKFIEQPAINYGHSLGIKADKCGFNYNNPIFVALLFIVVILIAKTH